MRQVETGIELCKKPALNCSEIDESGRFPPYKNRKNICIYARALRIHVYRRERFSPARLTHLSQCRSGHKNRLDSCLLTLTHRDSGLNGGGGRRAKG